jgi:hypothetical protein
MEGETGVTWLSEIAKLESTLKIALIIPSSLEPKSSAAPQELCNSCKVNFLKEIDVSAQFISSQSFDPKLY